MDFVSALHAEKAIIEEFHKKTPEELEEFYYEQETANTQKDFLLE